MKEFDNYWVINSINRSGCFEGRPKGLRAYCVATGTETNELIGKKILDLGSNVYSQLEMDIKNIRLPSSVISLSPDYSNKDIRKEVLKNNPNVCAVAALGQNLPFENGVFHLVFALHVLEHLTSYTALKFVILETGRVLKPDGRGFLGFYTLSQSININTDFINNPNIINILDKNNILIRNNVVSEKYGLVRAYDDNGIALGWSEPLVRIDILKKK